MPAAASATRRPIVTANQVTLARLVLLPLGAWLLYQGTTGQWVALVSMTIVGCTDFVDGWLARKYGPTVLGGLMDPIADKVFIALTMLPALDLGWLPVEIVALIFFREFVITAARTAYSRRDVALRTSYLAKVKTWYQMMLAGMIFLLNVAEPTQDPAATPPRAYMILVVVCAAGPIIGGIIFFIVKRRLWKGSVAFALSFGALIIASSFTTRHQLALCLGWSTVLITWASGAVYLVGMRDLKGRKPGFDTDDAVRFLGAITMPVFACLLIDAHLGPAWPLFGAVALEFSIGGLDNLLAHQKRLGSWRPWAARVGLQALLLGTAVFAAYTNTGVSLVAPLSFAAFGVTLLGAAIAFWRDRDAYLDADRRRQPLGAEVG